AIFLSLFIYTLYKRNFNKLYVGLILLGLLILIPIIQFHTLHVPLPYGRNSLYFSTLFGIVIVLFLEQLNTENKISKKSNDWSRALAIVISIPLVLNFFINVNTYSVYDWKYDCCTKEAVKLIDEK